MTCTKFCFSNRSAVAKTECSGILRGAALILVLNSSISSICWKGMVGLFFIFMAGTQPGLMLLASLQQSWEASEYAGFISSNAIVYLLVACLTSQQYAIVSKEWVCSGTCTSYHTL